ncbi:RNA polymerase-binding protein DksA [Campylobacter sp.]|uniref:RNA polymerase-binding protein DksA n=1 Tax=Campylobacter sp. TaxID=205 RepID=UPI0026DAF53A|nr:RNA polymerase-binding protein DksA [Campylobacter sp.]MDO4673579.1 RNA polymerase-binding protein DksA [Campylobacter sp.]
MKKKEFDFFEKFLRDRRKIILDNLQNNFEEIKALHNSAPSDSVDFSVIESNSQIDLAISANLKQELKDIEESLQKITQGLYGICEACDEFIDIKRLKIKPHARYCFACRQSLEGRKV